VVVVVILCWWCYVGSSGGVGGGGVGGVGGVSSGGSSGVILVRERRKEEVEGEDVYMDSWSPKQGWLVLLCLTIQCSIADSGIVTGINASIVVLNS
jgi:hypothetical protein